MLELRKNLLLCWACESASVVFHSSLKACKCGLHFLDRFKQAEKIAPAQVLGSSAACNFVGTSVLICLSVSVLFVVAAYQNWKTWDDTQT